VPRAILEAEKMPPELGTGARVRGVKDHLPQVWDRGFLHAADTIKASTGSSYLSKPPKLKTRASEEPG
jgi:hypothetical protein